MGDELAHNELSVQKNLGNVLQWQYALHCVSNNDRDIAHYNFDTDQPILVIFGRDIAERVCYRMVICFLTFPN